MLLFFFLLFWVLHGEQCLGSNYYRGNEVVSLSIGSGVRSSCEQGEKKSWCSIQLLITEDMELTQKHIFLQNNDRVEKTHSLECYKSHVLKTGETALLKETPSNLTHRLNMSLEKSTLLIFFFFYKIAYWFLTRTMTRRQPRGAWQVPKVKQASRVNETTRLSVYTSWPSPCHTKHFTTMAAAFLWFFSQQVCSS